MTYAVTIDVHAPAAVYQGLHAQLLERTGGQVDGLLVHLARPTADGFQVLEVWDTKASYDHYNDTVIAPLTTEAGLTPPAGTDTGNGAAAQPPTLAMSVTEIDVSGLVIPRGPIAFFRPAGSCQQPGQGQDAGLVWRVRDAGRPYLSIRSRHGEPSSGWDCRPERRSSGATPPDPRQRPAPGRAPRRHRSRAGRCHAA